MLRQVRRRSELARIKVGSSVPRVVRSVRHPRDPRAPKSKVCARIKNRILGRRNATAQARRNATAQARRNATARARRNAIAQAQRNVPAQAQRNVPAQSRRNATVPLLGIGETARDQGAAEIAPARLGDIAAVVTDVGDQNPDGHVLARITVTLEGLAGDAHAPDVHLRKEVPDRDVDRRKEIIHTEVDGAVLGL